jgi:hypothetical protein
MATVKIRDLPYITSLQSNTSNTVLVGVDVPGDFTGQMTLTTLANGLYSNNFLRVGNNEILLANAVGQFTGNANPYLQVSIHNNDALGSGDFVVTADNGTDTTHYVDLGIQGSQLTQGALLPLDGYVISVGDTAATPGGNLLIGTLTPNRNVSVLLGGTENNNVAAEFIYNVGFKLTQKPLIFADGTSQNSAVAYSGVDSRISSNVATLRGEITSNVNTINGSITANIATVLANTSGVTTAGVFRVSGRLFPNNITLIANSTYDYVNTALLMVNGSTGAAGNTVASPGYMLHVVGVDGVASRIINTSYGSGTYGLYSGRHANGTAANPSAVLSGDVIARYSGSGFNGTSFSSTGQGRIDIVADENFTTANNGTRIEFWNTIPLTNTLTKIATFSSNSATFLGVVSPMKGFVYTPRIFTSAQTAISISFINDSMVKTNIAAPLTVSFGDYYVGKEVILWITNTSGTGQVFTHGCSALNSTTNSTTYNIPGTSSIMAKYISFGTDAANVFVSVVHS